MWPCVYNLKQFYLADEQKNLQLQKKYAYLCRFQTDTGKLFDIAVN